VTAAPSDPASHVSRPLDAVAVAMMLMLCLSWGFNQIAIKATLPDIPPLTQAAIRSTGATVIVLAWSLVRDIPLMRRDGTLWPGLIAGALFGLEFLLIYRGLVLTTASRAVLFIYTAPFFVVVGTRWFLPGDRFHLSQWLGLALSFAGIAVAFGLPAPSANPREIIGDVMILIAAVVWAATTLVIKASTLAEVPPEKTTLYQLMVSAVMLAAGALFFGEHIDAMPSAHALGWLTYQTVWVVSITFLIWFGLVIRYSANRLSAFSFLTPLFGVAAGHLIMDDPLTPAFAVAAALVAGGLALVNRVR
jgi:drug/metabolite transporter (DMT)-like permease